VSALETVLCGSAGFSIGSSAPLVSLTQERQLREGDDMSMMQAAGPHPQQAKDMTVSNVSDS
jgi:hypothetical protein